MTILPRIVETLVGPPSGVGYVFREEYQEFKVKGYSSSKPNECEVTIHNLSSRMIAFLEAPNQVLQLSAGQGAAGLLFRGEIQPRGVTTKLETSERTTTIKAVDGRVLWRDEKVSLSWPPNTTVQVVVMDLLRAATAQGLAIAPGNTYPPDSFPAGYYHPGRWRDAMTEVLWPRGFGWTIQDRTIYVGPSEALAPGNVPLLTPQTGLIGSPERTKAGCNFECVLDPRVRPGWGATLKSAMTTGTFRVVVREHDGDSDGGKWITKAQCEKIKGQVYG